MIGMKRGVHNAGGAKTAVPLVVPVLLGLLLGLGACASTDRFGGGQPDQASTPPPAAPPPPVATAPPPVDVAGKWKLAVAGGKSCTMTFGGSTGAGDGSVAPAGGCPGNFFTSRKWSYERNMLVIRDHKGEELVELSFVSGHFEGQAPGGSISLTR
jgi:hypothetical protein